MTPHPPQLKIHAETTPAPQGSKKAFTNPKTGRAILVESAGNRLATYRTHVTTAATRAAQQQNWTPPTTGIQAVITFWLPRPKSHYRTGRNQHLLTNRAPHRPTTRPDIDKLERATLDALTKAEVIPDDSHITKSVTLKRYAHPGQPAGVTITLTADTDGLTIQHQHDHHPQPTIPATTDKE